MDIKEKLAILGLPEEYVNGSFVAAINLIDVDKALKYKEYFAYYGVTLTKASELKYYLLNEIELNNILAKLQYCKNNGIPVVDEQGNNKSFLFDLSKKHSEWTILYPDADLTSIIPDVFRDREALNADLLNTLNRNITVGLNEDNYDRYVELERTLTLVTQAINGTGNINPEVSNNLIKLIAANSTYSDPEVLFAALIYNQNKSAEEIEVIKNTINEVMASLNQEGTRAL